MGDIARHLTIHGRVQGVFYRDWATETARELALVGWVRNRADGMVELHIEGEEQALERFIVLARGGPPAAKVKHIDEKTTETAHPTRFERR